MARMEATGIAREWMQLVRLPPGPTTTPSLLSAAALGSETPLLWVACRTSPCLVHVFLDGHLLVSSLSLQQRLMDSATISGIVVSDLQ